MSDEIKYTVQKTMESALRDKQRAASPITHSLRLVKECFRKQLGLRDVVILTSTNRALAMRQYFKTAKDVKYPFCFLFVTSVGLEGDISPSVRNLMRTSTGWRIQSSEKTQSVLSSFLIPGFITVDFSIFFDDEYEALYWANDALVGLGGRLLGGELKFEGFTFDVRQKDPVSELSMPEREPDNVPHPNCVEYSSSVSFRTKFGRVKETAKFNNENHLTMNIGIENPEGSEILMEDVLGDSCDAQEENFGTISRKAAQQRLMRNS